LAKGFNIHAHSSSVVVLLLFTVSFAAQSGDGRTFWARFEVRPQLADDYIFR
jgi:hypothetical protein